MRTLMFALAATLLIASAGTALAQERDGKAWQGFNEYQKYTYMTGLLDGVTTGADFSLPVLSRGSVSLYKPDKACVEKTQTTYDYNTSRYFFGLSLRDFVEGIDAFYQDPQNQGIPVNRAVRVFAMKRKNVPEAGEILEELRREWGKGQ